MAGFRTHVTTSAVLGCGYAGVGHVVGGMPLDTAVVAGAMCGFSGMLPDLDSDYGVPLRETMAFSAAIVPMLLVSQFQSFVRSHDSMVLATVLMYLLIRFGVTRMIRKYTMHRGMFHSIPAGLVFAGIAFLVSGAAPVEIRFYKAGGVLAGFMSHLLLDEIYAVEFKGGRWRFKKSFGTAFKLWGDDGWSNFSTYAKLAIVAMLILGEPTVVERLGTRHPQFAGPLDDLRTRWNQIDAGSTAQGALDAARTAIAPFTTNPAQPAEAAPERFFPFAPAFPPVRNDFDTAKRPPAALPQ